MKYKAFTLTETMVTLVVIGILACTIIPIARKSLPNENVLKFKKAHEQLYRVINTLVTSDKYYCNGYLGKKADCKTWSTFSNGGNYFCKVIADLLSVKSVNCYNKAESAKSERLLTNERPSVGDGTPIKKTVTDETIQKTKEFFDSACKEYASIIGAEIITTDGIVYYQTGTSSWGTSNDKMSYGSPPDQSPANIGDQNGFDIYYKIVCIDIDGIGTGEDPFGYGIRADGKIMPGVIAEQWLEKSIKDE